MLISYNNLTGEIVGVFSNEQNIEVFNDSPFIISVVVDLDEFPDPNSQYISDTEELSISERPTVSPPISSENNNYSFESLPDGAVLKIKDVELNTYLATIVEENNLITLELPDTGRYLLELELPFPYVNKEFEIEVT
jgi:hypothetical protein